MKSIKSKITFGAVALFAIILLVSGFSIYFINQLASQTKGTIIDNYRSIEYVNQMHKSFKHLYMQAVKDGRDKAVLEHARETFEKNLRLESENITEIGEADAVRKLQSGYDEFLGNIGSGNVRNSAALDSSVLKVEREIDEVARLNLLAIRNKSTQMQATAEAITVYMSGIVTLFILIAVSFISAFPTSIVQPLKELVARITSISDGNYQRPLSVPSMAELQEVAQAFNTMAEKLKAFEAKQVDKLLFEQKRMDALVQNLEDGVILIDENRIIVLINKTMAGLIGLTTHELLGQSISGLCKNNELLREIYARSKRIIEGNAGEEDTKPLQIFAAEKEQYYKVESESILTFSEWLQKDIFIGTLILLKDVTTFQQRDKAKTNLLATVSHELKTPLASINLSLKLLEDSRTGGLNPEQVEAVSALKQQSQRLSRVINEILEFSQIETGNIKLKFSQIRPDEILDISVTALMVLVSEKQIDLQTEIDEDLPTVNVDIEKIVFVLINILNNAIRYTPLHGVIRITCRSEMSGIVFSVKDNGPGISTEDQEKLFQRYTQVGKGYKRGWGLGLAISKEFINAQGGKIWLQSELGKGSEFFISLPV
ncbi:MAG: PAS domain-containing protein [Ignavibacteriales bacterium]|nr:PAS domain-containing protein [Ignavibacteriales bacterium]